MYPKMVFLKIVILHLMEFIGLKMPLNYFFSANVRTSNYRLLIEQKLFIHNVAICLFFIVVNTFFHFSLSFPNPFLFVFVSDSIFPSCSLSSFSLFFATFCFWEYTVCFLVTIKKRATVCSSYMLYTSSETQIKSDNGFLYCLDYNTILYPVNTLYHLCYM